MSGHRLGADFLKAYSANLLSTADPGDGNAITLDNNSHTICGITTTTTETRTLPDPAGLPVGTELTVYHTVDEGQFTLTVDSTTATAIDSAGTTSLVFADDGDLAQFKVISREGANYWNLLNNQTASGTGQFETVITTNVLTVEESGKTFFLDLAGGFTTTLPAPVAGLYYKFIVKTQPTTAYVFETLAGANIIKGGFVTSADGLASDTSQVGDSVSFAANQAVPGDWIEFTSDGTSYFLFGYAAVEAGIVIAST